MCETIGERHASACRYEKEIPDGSHRSALQTDVPTGQSLNAGNCLHLLRKVWFPV